MVVSPVNDFLERICANCDMYEECDPRLNDLKACAILMLALEINKKE